MVTLSVGELIAAGKPDGQPEANPAGEELYARYVKASRAANPEDYQPDDISVAVRFAEKWMRDAMPATDDGKISFGRALLESVIESAYASGLVSREDE